MAFVSGHARISIIGLMPCVMQTACQFSGIGRESDDSGRKSHASIPDLVVPGHHERFGNPVDIVPLRWVNSVGIAVGAAWAM